MHLIRKRILGNARVLRYFSSSSATYSGHSKWATIKHDKQKKDKTRSKQTAAFLSEINIATRCGPNPAFNPRLASAILRAKKASCTKENIDNAIARGQGRSASGAPLKTFLDGAILPELGGVSILIDCLTDNQKALQMDIRVILKSFSGTAIPTTHQFSQVGQIRWPASDQNSWLKFVDGACEREELGVEEYWRNEGSGEWMVELPISSIKDMEDHIASKTGVTEASSEIIWKPLETFVIDSEASKRLGELIEELEDLQDVRTVYSDSTLSTS